uniref:HDC12057 n=1 Tax=Drosophila melanogaster TaxID=7227 RepID=Q6IKM6_DROME|nr:TPA_inf: HDC12057 [Drosophila melanogaster]
MASLNPHKCTFALILIGIVGSNGNCNCHSQWRQAIVIVSEYGSLFTFDGRLSLGRTLTRSGKAVNWRLPGFIIPRQCDSICCRSNADHRSQIANPETFSGGGSGIGIGIGGRNCDSGACPKLILHAPHSMFHAPCSIYMSTGCENQ